MEWLLLKREDPGSNPVIEILIKQLLYFQIEMIKIKKKFARMVGLFQNYNCHVIQISFTQAIFLLVHSGRKLSVKVSPEWEKT